MEEIFLLTDYKIQFQSFKKNQRKLKTLKEDSDKAKADQDYFQFLFDELDTAAIRKDEQENLENELNSLSHSEEIKKNLLGANFLIDNGEASALPKLKEALSQLQSLEKYQPTVLAFADRLKSAIIEIKDINDELENLEQSTSFNENRLESDMHYTTQSDLKKLFGKQAINFLDPQIDSITTTVNVKNKGTELWKLCLILSLVFIGIEILLIKFYSIHKQTNS